MKTHTFLLVAIMAAIFCSCSNDSDSTPNFLEGTKWVSDDDEMELFTIEFQRTTATFIFQSDDNHDGIFSADENNRKVSMSYTLDGNNISIKAGKDEITGTVSGNKMTLYSDGDSVTYHKK